MFADDIETIRFAKSQQMPSAHVFGPRRRRRVNSVVIGFNLFVPWFLFCILFTVMSFQTHYDAPNVASGLVICSFSVPIISGILGMRAKQQDQDALWYAFSALSTFVAVVLAAVFGDMNFVYNNRPYYQIETLNMYPNVSPARAKGSQMMDAGRVYFKEGTGIDSRRAMGFRSHDLFCVAPIVIGNDKLASYDFWAVGKNCCSGVSADFRCGEYNNPNARSGLRLMRDDERQFYRLAVQQAEAAYGIKSTHPLFFHWMQDPVEEISHYQEAGMKNYLLGIFVHFAANLFGVVATVMLTVTATLG